jgi:acetylglutamate kinase
VTVTTQASDKAGVLIEALPYIRTYSGATVVIKIGGAALDDPDLASIVAEDLALLSFVGLKVVVVHGGGPQVSAAMEAEGLEPRFVGGLRVTDDEAMKVVSRVLVGSINLTLVARLQESGLAAVGLSGVDGGSIEVARARGPEQEDLGLVGRVENVDATLIQTLLDAGHTPVVASIARSRDGELLNVNADAVAGAIAGELQAAKLVYLTNVEGLYRDLGESGSLLSEIKRDELSQLVPGFGAGMRPKAESALAALDAGVDKIHILDGRVHHALLLEIFTSDGIGTQVLP